MRLWIFALITLLALLAPSCPMKDADRDGITDEEDNCLNVVNPDQADLDSDGIGDLCDVCPGISDPEQKDTDDDGIGEACEGLPLKVGALSELLCTPDGNSYDVSLDVAIGGLTLTSANATTFSGYQDLTTDVYDVTITIASKDNMCGEPIVMQGSAVLNIQDSCTLFYSGIDSAGNVGVWYGRMANCDDPTLGE